MNNIEWKDGAVCYANKSQWLAPLNVGMIEDCMIFDNFQLNEIRIGDYIEKSELGTEQKYNDVVEVFGLFGFRKYESHSGYSGLMDGWRALKAGSNGFEWANFLVGRKLTYNQIMAIGKLKRMMLEREVENQLEKWGEYSVDSNNSNLTADFAKVSSNKYEREISDRQGNSATVDVYDVLKAFEVTCPATQHAVKKLLCSGLRGHKDLQTDLIEAKESIIRAIELNG